MKTLISIASLALMLYSCYVGQDQTLKQSFNPHLVGGACEGCEAVLEFPDQNLEPVDTLPGFCDSAKKIRVSGTIYQSDGKTPAEDVILYIYHTNDQGLYEPKPGAKGGEKQHGHLRGWVKTDCSGAYVFYTSMPAPYPGGQNPAHIHPIILEPNGKYYWLGAYHFAGDSLLSEKEIAPESPRGGSSGLLELEESGDLLLGYRDFILGENISDYND